MVDQQELSSAGLKFMDFAIRFFNMAKCQYQQQNQVKANKAGFHVVSEDRGRCKGRCKRAMPVERH